jgi:hypothetical protein
MLQWPNAAHEPTPRSDTIDSILLHRKVCRSENLSAPPLIQATLFISHLISRNILMGNKLEETFLCRNSCGMYMLFGLNRMSELSEIIKSVKIFMHNYTFARQRNLLIVFTGSVFTHKIIIIIIVIIVLNVIFHRTFSMGISLILFLFFVYFYDSVLSPWTAYM